MTAWKSLIKKKLLCIYIYVCRLYSWYEWHILHSELTHFWCFFYYTLIHVSLKECQESEHKFWVLFRGNSWMRCCSEPREQHASFNNRLITGVPPWLTLLFSVVCLSADTRMGLITTLVFGYYDRASPKVAANLNLIPEEEKPFPSTYLGAAGDVVSSPDLASVSESECPFVITVHWWVYQMWRKLCMLWCTSAVNCFFLPLLLTTMGSGPLLILWLLYSGGVKFSLSYLSHAHSFLEEVLNSLGHIMLGRNITPRANTEVNWGHIKTAALFFLPWWYAVDHVYSGVREGIERSSTIHLTLHSCFSHGPPVPTPTHTYDPLLRRNMYIFSWISLLCLHQLLEGECSFSQSYLLAIPTSKLHSKEGKKKKRVV